eukprot:gene10732-11881_t
MTVLRFVAGKLGNYTIAVIEVIITGAHLLSAVLAAGLYIKAYIRIRKFVSENPVHRDREAGSNDPSTARQQPRYVRELFKTILLLIIALVASYLPFTVAAQIRSGYRLANRTPPGIMLYVYDATVFILFTVHATNSMIVLYRNRLARDWLAAKLLWCSCQKRRIARNK